MGAKGGLLCRAHFATEPGMANLVFRRQVTIEWGHCDPDGMVFEPRLFELFDWNLWLLFEAALGMRPADLPGKFGIVGIPLVGAQARFLVPARFNDVADIASEVSEFRRSSFDVKHRLTIGGQLAVEGSETRVWTAQDASDPTRLMGAPIPAAIIARFKTV